MCAVLSVRRGTLEAASNRQTVRCKHLAQFLTLETQDESTGTAYAARRGGVIEEQARAAAQTRPRPAPAPPGRAPQRETARSERRLTRRTAWQGAHHTD